jgi:hypothetical protein
VEQTAGIHLERPGQVFVGLPDRQQQRYLKGVWKKLGINWQLAEWGCGVGKKQLLRLSHGLVDFL